MFFANISSYYPEIITSLTITTIALLLIYIKNSKTISQKNNELKHLEKENTIIKERYTSIELNLAKLETEKINLLDSLRQTENKLSALNACSMAKEENLQEKINYLEKIKEDLTLKFKDISSEIIKSQHDTFSKSQQTTLSQIITPFAEQLNSFKKEVGLAREESIKNKSNLDAQLANLLNLNQTLSNDAKNLAEALKGASKAQGNWGECQLSRILEISGLRKDQDYETQCSFTDENKKTYRPDVIIHLPDNRC